MFKMERWREWRRDTRGKIGWIISMVLMLGLLADGREVPNPYLDVVKSCDVIAIAKVGAKSSVTYEEKGKKSESFIYSLKALKVLKGGQRLVAGDIFFAMTEPISTGKESSLGKVNISEMAYVFLNRDKVKGWLLNRIAPDEQPIKDYRVMPLEEPSLNQVHLMEALRAQGGESFDPLMLHMLFRELHAAEKDGKEGFLISSRLGLEWKITSLHLMVGSVKLSTPASEGKFIPGDQVMHVEQSPVGSPALFEEMISRYQPGSRVKISIRRGSESFPLYLTLPNEDYSRPTTVFPKEAHSRQASLTPEESAKNNLRLLRSAISVYYGMNEGKFPKTLDELLLPQKDIKKTRLLEEIIDEPFTMSHRVQYLKPSEGIKEGDGGGGWLYNPVSGDVWMNLKSLDPKGVPYANY